MAMTKKERKRLLEIRGLYEALLNGNETTGAKHTPDVMLKMAGDAIDAIDELLEDSDN